MLSILPYRVNFHRRLRQALRKIGSSWSLTVLLAVSGTSVASGQTWTNFTNSGNLWSTASNWNPGLPGFNSTTTLTFDSNNFISDPNYLNLFSTGYNTVADGATTYNLNQMSVNGLISALVSANNAAGTISFIGTSPGISVNSQAGVQFLNGVATTDLTLTASGLTVTGSGMGSASFLGTIGGTGSLTINRGTLSPKYLGANVFLGPSSGAGNNTFIGTVTLNSGNLVIDQTNGLALGNNNNVLAVNGGTVQAFSTALSLVNAIQLGGTFHFTGSQNGSFLGTVTGTGNIRISTTGQATFLNAISAVGTITAEGLGAPTTLMLTSSVSAGFHGSALTATSMSINNSTLSLENGNGNATRLNVGGTLNLNTATLSISTSSTVNAVERVAALNLTGANQISFITGATRFSRFTADVVTPANGGTFLAATSGTTTLGSAPGGAANNNLFFSNLTSGSNINGILPYGYATPSTGSSSTRGGLVRYDTTNGVVALNVFNDYSFRLPQGFGSQPTVNVQLGNANSFATTGNGISNFVGAMTANSLSLDSNSGLNIGNSLYGTGSITLTSGTLAVSLSNGSTGPAIVSSVIQPSLLFGGTTGYLHAQANLVLAGNISGSNGLVKSEPGSMTLLGNNSGLSGGFTVNQGNVFITDENQLGAAGGTVTLNSGYGGGLGFAPTNQFGTATTTTLTVNRALSTGNNGGGLTVPAGLSLTWNGTISGSGMLVKSGTGVVALTGSNTYTGDTVIQAGSLSITNSSALGSSGNTVFLNGGYLQNNAVVTIGQDVVQRVNATISIPTIVTNSDMTITGNVGNTQTNITLVKAGAGNLTLTASNTFSAGIWVGYQTPTHFAGTSFSQPGGTLTLGGANGALPFVNSWTLNAGTMLVLDNSAGVVAHRLSLAPMTMNGGTEVKVVGNSGATVDTHTGSVNYQTSTINTYTLDQPASGGNGLSTRLTIPSTSSPAGSFNYYRGTNLGIPSATADYSLLKVQSMAPTTGVVGFYSNQPTGGPQDLATYTASNGIERFTAYTPLPTSGALSTVTYSTTGPLTFTASQFTAALKMTNSQIALAGFDGGPVNGGILLSTGTVGQDTITTTTGTPVIAFQGGVVARVSVNESLQIGTAANPVQVTQAASLEKFGPGVLILSGSFNIPSYQITQGTVRLLTNQFNNVTTVNLSPGAVFDINSQGSPGSAITINTLTGYGTVNLGSGAIQYGTTTGTFGGGFAGSGTVTLLGGFFQTLNGNSPGFSGNVQIGTGAGGVAGVVLDADVVPSNATNPGPLGTGTTPIQMGASSGSGVAILAHTALVNRVERDIAITSGGTGTVTIGNTTTSVGAYTTFTGNIALASTRTLNLIGGANGTTTPVGGNTVFSGAISGTGGGTNAITWTGGNISLLGNNTFVGNVLINSGRANVMGLGSDSAWGNSANVVNVPDSTVTGIFRADNGARTLNNPITYLGATVSNALGFTGTNDLTLNGNINLGTTANSSTRTWEVTSLGTTTINGVISGNTALTKEGAGTLILNGPNTFNGLTLQGGGLGIGANTITGVSGAIGIGAFTLNGGTLSAVGGARTINNFMTIGGSFAFEGSNNLTISPTSTVNIGSGVREIAVLGTGVLRMNGAHTGGTLSGIIKSGPGTLILGNPNAWGLSGTNVVEGKLLVNNVSGSATGTNPVTVGPSGLLGGNGFISSSVTVNGTLSPGMNTGSGTGIVSINNNLTLASGSTFRVEIGSFTGGSPPTAGIDYDQVALTATSSTYTIGSNVTLQGVRLSNFPAPYLSAWVIVNNSNVLANSGTGTFDGLPDGALFPFDGQTFQIRYNVGTYMVDSNGLTTLTPGGSIVIAAVPEPATWAMIFGSLASGIGSIFWYRRRSLRHAEHLLAQAEEHLEEE